MEQKKKGIIFIISGPSASGKTTIARNLFIRDVNLKQSISATTRKPRIGEIDKKHYFFITKKKFEDQIKKGEFLEHAEFIGEYYGTPLKYIRSIINKGQDVLLTIESKGFHQIQKKVKGKCVSIFIRTSTMEALKDRLENRGDAPEDIKRRLKEAKQMQSFQKEYDYLVTNDDLNEAIENVYSIIRAERSKQIGSKRITL